MTHTDPHSRGRRIAVRALTVLAAAAFTGGLTPSSALAVVLDMNARGQSTVPFNPGDQTGYYGVTLVPAATVQDERAPLQNTNPQIPTVVSGPPCTDPALPRDLRLPLSGLCSHGGPVMHRSETFTLTWDPDRRYFGTTRNYVEQFLADVSAGAGTLTSPFADTTQYTDSRGRAGNISAFGGGCIDYGVVGGASCRTTGGNGAAGGHDYPANVCPASGTNEYSENPDGSFSSASNDICLTDAQIRTELASVIQATDVLAHTTPGYTPLIVVLTPPGVVDCLDAGGQLCSANSTQPARFCSYHSQVTVQGIKLAYAVQPWTASWHSQNGCDEPDVPGIPDPPPVLTLATDLGIRLVSPLSQAQMAAITDPNLNGWFALDGSEINDNGCHPFAQQLDKVTVGTSAQNPYYLQREFNNAGVIETDPNALACTADVALQPAFVVPSAITAGDVVQLDGSTSISALIIPQAGYAWSFGDGKVAIGPSVEHRYARAGVFAVKLTITDRGGHTTSLTQTIKVRKKSGLPGPGGRPNTGPALSVRLALLPEGLGTVTSSGVSVRVTANERANGTTEVLLANPDAARAGLGTSRSGAVRIGLGTVTSIRRGSVILHLRLTRGLAAKVRRLGHATLTIRLVLVGSSGDRASVVVAGHY